MTVELIMLFFDGHPLVFEVSKKQKSYFFTPLTSWKDTLVASTFSLQRINGEWKAIGASDRNIIDQAIEEIERRPF
ncbi:hypothetical protein [Flavisolibacter tropicus]|nr:hypothetical protein [Flavisolibacter tropicus]